MFWLWKPFVRFCKFNYPIGRIILMSSHYMLHSVVTFPCSCLMIQQVDLGVSGQLLHCVMHLQLSSAKLLLSPCSMATHSCVCSFVRHGAKLCLYCACLSFLSQGMVYALSPCIWHLIVKFKNKIKFNSKAHVFILMAV